MQRHEFFHLRSAGPTVILLVTLLVATSAAQAQVTAEAPAAATNSSVAAPAANPLGGTGFITVQGNKFVDANCKVSSAWQSMLQLIELDITLSCHYRSSSSWEAIRESS